MSVAKKYSKSIIKKFDMIPVYYPGEEIKPGDILDFGSSLFRKAAKPIGTFTNHGNLARTHSVDFEVTESKYPKTINLISSKEVSVKPAIKAVFPGVAEGDIQFDFTSEGSFLLFGIDAIESKIDNLISFRDQLKSLHISEDWDRYYIVTSVTVCKKALVYAAQEKGGTLIISANTDALSIVNESLSGLNADVSIDVKWKSKAAFSNDWDDNVTVLMKLAQFKRESIRPYDKMAISDYNFIKRSDIEKTDLSDFNKESGLVDSKGDFIKSDKSAGLPLDSYFEKSIITGLTEVDVNLLLKNIEEEE